MKKLLLILMLAALLFGTAAAEEQPTQWTNERGTLRMTATVLQNGLTQELSALLDSYGYGGWQCLHGAAVETERLSDPAGGKSLDALLALECNGLHTLVSVSSGLDGRFTPYGMLGLRMEEITGISAERTQDGTVRWVLETADSVYWLLDDGGQGWCLAGWKTSDGFEAQWVARGQIKAEGQIFPVWETPYLKDVGFLNDLPQNMQQLQALSEVSMQRWADTGLAMLSGVNLRKDHSSSSEWLGTARAGVLAEVLDTREGTTEPWYQIRLGDLVCWASGPYVRLPESGQPGFLPLVTAQARRDTVLLQSDCATEMRSLPQGTQMQLLAEMADDWLIVTVPNDGTAGWRMETDSMIGWVRRSDVDMDR